MVAYVRDNLADGHRRRRLRAPPACRSAPSTATATRRLGFGLRTLIREVRIMRAMEILGGRATSRCRRWRAPVGFASVPSFTTAFSERLGVSPSEFARRVRAVAG